MRRTMQIDVVGTTDFDQNIVECKLYANDRTCKIYMSKIDYEALMQDGIFVRDGKSKDSAGVVNTTNTFEEKIYK